MVPTPATSSSASRSLPVDERTLIVGLGNPAVEYGNTRHNLGADAVRLLADDLGVRLTRHRAGGIAADGRLGAGGPAITLFVPSGYMNNSGGPVQMALRFYKLSVERLVVIHDDLDLDPWVVRLKHGGGPGGHNGLRDIIARCGSREFDRVRIGVGRPPGRQDPARYVLARIPSTLQPDAEHAVQRAADAARALVSDGLESAQNTFHAPAS